MCRQDKSLLSIVHLDYYPSTLDNLGRNPEHMNYQ